MSSISLARVNTKGIAALGDGFLQQGLREDDGWHEIHEDQITVFHNFFHHSSQLRAAYETIHRFVFAGDIKVEKTRGDFQLKPHIKEKINTEWIRFCIDLLQALFVYGFAAVSIAEQEQRPVVRNILDLNVFWRLCPDGISEYCLYERQRGTHILLPGDNLRKPLSTVVLFESYAPNSLGQLLSPLRSLMELHSFKNLYMKTMARAIQRQAAPPLFTQKKAITLEERNQQRDAVGVGDHSRAILNQQYRQQSQRTQQVMRHEAEVRSRNAPLQPAPEPILGDAQFWSTHLDPITQTPVYPVDLFGRGYAHARIPLPEGEEIVNGPTATTPTDLADIFTFWNDEVGKVTGVPPQLWGSQRSAEAVNQTVLNTFYATLQRTRSVLQYAVKIMLKAVFGKEDLDHLFHHYDHQKSIEQNVEDNDFRVSMPGMLDPEILRTLEEEGLFTFSRYAEFTENYYGLARGTLSRVRLDPLTDRPLKEVIEKQEKLEERMAEEGIKANQAKRQQSVGASSGQRSGQTGRSATGQSNKRPASSTQSNKRQSSIDPVKKKAKARVT